MDAGQPLLRRILHVDMDAFYASVAQRDDPSLRGRPVAVGGDPKSRAVVCAASYEARIFGVRSALPMAQAVRLCPDLVVVRPDFARYKAVSAQVFAIFREVTPLVEPLSLDEAYLDATENAWGLTLGAEVAARIKERIHAETGLTASAGVAPNKFLAKVASAFRKPDGLTVVAPARIEAFLEKLEVEALWGVGPVTARRLRALGIVKLTDVRAASPEALTEAVGSQAEWLRRLAHGIDDRRVVPDRERKSLGHEETYETDLVDPARIRAEVEALARQAARGLVSGGLEARTVTLKVRWATFERITRSDTSETPTADADAIARRALDLIARTDAGRRPLRLLGVSLHGLWAEGAPPPEPKRRTARTSDEGPLQLSLPLD